MSLLEIQELHAGIEDKEILKGIRLSVGEGELHAIMGPNGSGKSTLANVIMGHPKYTVNSGSIRFLDQDLGELEAFERARMGLFLSFQYPFEVEGLKLSRFLYSAYKERFPDEKISVLEFNKKLQAELVKLSLPAAFASRETNVGFSGGEKKRCEIMQMNLLRPRLAILDETDSGLDIDSLKLVAQNVNASRRPDFSAIVITHYTRILTHLKPDFVHVLHRGKIVASGDAKLAHELEEKGYEKLLGIPAEASA